MKYDKGRIFAAALISGGGVAACLSWAVNSHKDRAVEGNSELSRIVMSPGELDVSAGKKGEPAHVHFEIKNEGRETVKIAGVGTSCGCTLPAPLKRRELKSGESMDLEVTATPPGIGEKTTYIDIFVSPSDRPAARAVLHLKGNPLTAPRIVNAPHSVIVRGVFPQSPTANFTIITDELEGEREWIERIDSDDEGITIKLETVSNAPSGDPSVTRRVYHFAAEAKPKQPGRGRFGRLAIVTRTKGSERRPPIPVMFDWKSAIEASPSALFAEVSDDELPKTFQLLLQTRGSLEGTPLEVVPSADNWLELGDITAQGDEASCVTRLPVTIRSMPKVADGGSWRSLIRIKARGTDLTVDIPVHVRRDRELAPE